MVTRNFPCLRISTRPHSPRHRQCGRCRLRQRHYSTCEDQGHRHALPLGTRPRTTGTLRHFLGPRRLEYRRLFHQGSTCSRTPALGTSPRQNALPRDPAGTGPEARKITAHNKATRTVASLILMATLDPLRGCVKSSFARHSAIRLLISLLSKVVKSFALISLCISPNSIRFISVNGHSAILAFDSGRAR